MLSNQENVDHWMIEDGKLLNSDKVAGLLANSHLSQFGKGDPEGLVLNASKDLRLFDETLTKVIIIDDNPMRILQHANQRLVKKFFASQYCTLPEGDPIRLAFANQFKVIQKEIEESLTYSLKSEGKVTFAAAYRPYTMMGQIAVKWLQESLGWDQRQTVHYLRQNPKFIDQKVW